MFNGLAKRDGALLVQLRKDLIENGKYFPRKRPLIFRALFLPVVVE
jgi:hypothetical protein